MANGKIFVIADTHFGHEQILNYEKRPFADVDIMDKELIKNWNSVVTSSDTVFHLGDVTFRNKEQTVEILSKLKGRKILIEGNHDTARSLKWWYDVGFAEVYKYPIIFNDFFVLSHKPPAYFNEATPYFYLYGHVHSSEMYRTITKQTACVSVERWDYKPVSLDKIIELNKLAT